MMAILQDRYGSTSRHGQLYSERASKEGGTVTQFFGRLEIDHQLKFGRLLNRQFGGVGAF